MTLRLDPSARWVAEYYPVEDTADLDDGGLRVTLRAGDSEWLTRLMLRIGGSAQIEDPSELSDVVRLAATEALRNYT